MPDSSSAPQNPPDSQPTAIITGASSGIGEQTARLLAKRGYATVLIARRVDRLNDLARELQSHAPSTPLGIDLAEPGAVQRGIEIITSRHPRIDVLINNAGYGNYQPFLDQSLETHRRLYEVNYFAAAALTHAFLPGMIRAGRGHVINIASVAARFGPWGHGAYAGAKAALLTLTQCLACEYQDHGVNFSCVLPGLVRTEFFDRPDYQALQSQVSRHGIEPIRIARAIVRLLDRPRLEVWMPRHYRAVDWLKLLLPRTTFGIIRKQSKPPAPSPRR